MLAAQQVNGKEDGGRQWRSSKTKAQQSANLAYKTRTPIHSLL